MKGNIRIAVALVFGILIVLGAFYVRHNTSVAEQGAIAVVPSAEAVKEYIRVNDSDSDGTSDWEEELQQKTIREADALGEFETPEGEGAPLDETLTGQFARSFFERYVRGKMTGKVSDETKTQFLGSSLGTLEAVTRDVPLTKKDITVGDSSMETARAYGNAVADITFQYSLTAGEEDVLLILKDALDVDDEARLSALDPYIASYEQFLAETKKLAAPPQLVNTHLSLLNTYQALLGDLRAMRDAFNDPLRSLIRVKRYGEDEVALLHAITSLYASLHATGIRYTDEEPAARFGFMPE